MISKGGNNFLIAPPASNTNPSVFTIEADAYSEEESSQKIENNEEDDDDDYYSTTTTESQPHISKVPIFISSPKIPDDIILPNVPSHISYTESETQSNSISPLHFDQSSLETSHISSFIIETTYDTPKNQTKSQEEEEEDYKISSTSSSSSISIKYQSSKQQISPRKHIVKQPNKKELKVKQQNKKELNVKQQMSKELNTKQSTPQEQNAKQSNAKFSNGIQKNLKQVNSKPQQKNFKQTSLKPQQKNLKQANKLKASSNSSSDHMIVNLPTSRDKRNRKMELSSDDESVQIYSSSDTMSCQSGTFSDYSTTTSLSSTTKEKSRTNLSDYSSLSANETIKTYDETKAVQRMIPPPEPPTICCVLV